jgi:4-amino-4-deoxy-L-arabinose transferase-like glycosyltransferase
MAFNNPVVKKFQPVQGISDRAFFACSILLFALVILTMLYASSFFMDNESVTYDTGRFFAMAKVIVSGATPYLDYQDPKPPLIFFTLTLPLLIGQQFLGGLLLVGICNMASAVIVMRIAGELYGRFAGLAAGLLFLVNFGWAQGYFVMTEPFTVVFLLLATYFALFSKDRHFLAAGLCAGIAIGFKQYALIAVPLLLLALYLNDELKRAPAFLAGLALPLFAIFGTIFLVYGAKAMDASLYYSFGVAGPYISRTNVDPVISTGTDALELAFNIVIAVIISASLILGLTRFGRNRKRNMVETYLLLSAVGFSLTLLIRQYLHYWALALPFLAILWAGWLFRDDQ